MKTSVEEKAVSWSPNGSAKGEKLRVLVVEDNKDCATTTADLLRLDSHEVWVALDGPTALEIARNHPPDVVLLDIGLPGMSGYELAKKFIEEAKRKRPLLVAVTGYGQEEDRQLSAAAGIDLHLLKPVDPASLQALLSRFRAIIKE